MKRIFAFLFVVSLFSFVGNVNAGPGGEECEIITIYCGDEPTTNLIACGSDKEKMRQVEEVVDLFCD